MKKALLTLFVMTLATTGHAQIYKCTGANGALVFSQKPCGADAQEVVYKDTTAGVTIVGEGDFSRVEAANRDRDISRSIERRYQTISGLQNQRDAKLDDLRRQQRRAANNLAGATYLQSIATEMQSVSEDYNARISMERDAIRDLQMQRNQ